MPDKVNENMFKKITMIQFKTKKIIIIFKLKILVSKKSYIPNMMILDSFTNIQSVNTLLIAMK